MLNEFCEKVKLSVLVLLSDLTGLSRTDSDREWHRRSWLQHALRYRCQFSLEDFYGLFGPTII